ncbi:MAG: TIGR01777 family oxidoreductase [Chitinophagaceae bacterium]
MATVLITGGTGLIGTALTKALVAKGYKVTILTRAIPKTDRFTPNVSYAEWNIEEQIIDEQAIKNADYIIHLAGANIAEHSWTEERKKEIVESRTSSSALLVKALNEIVNDVKAVTSASGVGWYGQDPKIPNPTPFDENFPADTGFLGQACKQWEESIEPVTALGVRLVKLRTGLVFSNDGGAYKEFKKPLKYGVAAIFGKGKQVISWIHIHDLVRLYIATIEDAQWSGVYNAVTPYPVTNKRLMLTIARTRKKFFIPFRVPAPVLKKMFGELSTEVLKSTTVIPAKVQASGFVYRYPTAKEAIQKLEA